MDITTSVGLIAGMVVVTVGRAVIVGPVGLAGDVARVMRLRVGLAELGGGRFVARRGRVGHVNESLRQRSVPGHSRT